jgi:proline dehydrogenase
MGVQQRAFAQSHSTRPKANIHTMSALSNPSSTTVSATTSSPSSSPTQRIEASLSPPIPSLPPLSLMPTSLLLRSYFMTRILSSPRLLKATMPSLSYIAESPYLVLNPDRNPILHFALRKLIYDHFNAGENEREVKQTVRQMKKLGFKGVILGYAKEVNVSSGARGLDAVGTASEDLNEIAVREWKEGTLKTLSLIGEGDFLAVKYFLLSKF